MCQATLVATHIDARHEATAMASFWTVYRCAQCDRKWSRLDLEEDEPDECDSCGELTEVLAAARLKDEPQQPEPEPRATH